MIVSNQSQLLIRIILVAGISLAVRFFYLSPRTTELEEKNSESSSVQRDLFAMFGLGSSNKNQAWKDAQNVYEFTVKDLDENDVKLDKYKGQVLIIVNVASRCGYTKQNYKELNELYGKYRDQGLAILGFPCNQFAQEPGCSVDLKEFAKKNNVEWDLFAKVDVNGDSAIPLFQWLKSKAGGTLIDAIKWNFTKFLINKEGVPVARYSPNKSPLEFEDELKAELNK